MCYTAANTTPRWTQWNPFDAGTCSKVAGQLENWNKRCKNLTGKKPPKNAGRRRSGGASVRTSERSQQDNKSDTERRPGPLWESATHILTAHHSSRPLAGQIINPACRGYMGLLTCPTCLPCNTQDSCLASSSLYIHLTRYAASRQLKTFPLWVLTQIYIHFSTKVRCYQPPR